MHGQLNELVSVEPASPHLTDEDWAEISAALVAADTRALSMADFGALFLLSQAALKRSLAHAQPAASAPVA